MPSLEKIYFDKDPNVLSLTTMFIYFKFTWKLSTYFPLHYTYHRMHFLKIKPSDWSVLLHFLVTKAERSRNYKNRDFNVLDIKNIVGRGVLTPLFYEDPLYYLPPHVSNLVHLLSVTSNPQPHIGYDHATFDVLFYLMIIWIYMSSLGTLMCFMLQGTKLKSDT